MTYYNYGVVEITVLLDIGEEGGVKPIELFRIRVSLLTPCLFIT